MLTSITRSFRNYSRCGGLLWRYGSHHKLLLTLFTFLSVFGVVTESVGVFLLVPLLDSMGKNNIFSSVALLGDISRVFQALPAESRLVWAGSLMLVVVILRSLLQLAQDVIGYAIPHRVDLALRTRAFNTLVGTSMRFVDQLGAGQVSNVSVAHPARIGIALRFAAVLLANFFVIISYVFVLALVAPFMCLVAAVYVLLSTLLFKRVTNTWVHRVGRDLTDANQRFGQIFYELLNGARLIRLAGATAYVQQELGRTIGVLRGTRDRTVFVENLTVPFFSLIGGTLVCLLVIMVGLMNSAAVAQAVGVLVLFVVLLFRILAPLSLINIARNNIVIHLEAFEEMEKFFDAASKAEERDGSVTFEGLRKGIRLENASLAYRHDQKPVIEAIDISFPKGSFTAFVGESGSGKSSIINLITRLYRADAGRVLVDDRPIEDLVIESWWQRLAVVTQDVIVTNDTIRANLCFGLREHVSDAKLWEAAKLADIDHWISSEPLQMDTVLGERGGLISGGQRQRIALARAFLRDPDVLILDEATSALDALSEQRIRRRLVEYGRDKTVIVIAHRLSMVRDADQIAVLDRGKIVETGTHDELIRRRGSYWKLAQAQSLDEQAPDPDADQALPDRLVTSSAS